MALALLATAWFFRFQIASGFTLFSGDRYDAMIEIAIEQHWLNVFEGREGWSRMAYFAPIARSIGYNDGYFVYGLLYALFRHAGLPLVAASEAVHAVMKPIGFVGMLLLLSGPARCRWRWALFGATLFTVADVTLRHVNHAQLLTVAFAPWCALFAWRAIAALNEEDGSRLRRNGLAFAALFALWISTAYYLAWFFAFYLLIALVVWLAAAGAAGRRAMRDHAARRRTDLALIGAAAVVLLAPFLSVYLTKALETHTRGFSNIKHAALSPLDYVNPGAANLLWSPLFAPFFRWRLKSASDDVFGIGPLLFGLAMIAIVRQWRGGDRGRPLAVAAMALAVSWALLFRIWVISPWYLVHALVPGASALRAIGRFQIVLLVPATAFATILLDHARRRWLAHAAAALLLLEQTAVTAAPVSLDQADQLALLSDIPPPPPACAVFVVRSSRPYPYPPQDPRNDTIYAHNVEAMTLAEAFARPTLNGFSSFNPPGWDFARPEAPDYLDRVRHYAGARGLTRLCLLDRRRGILWRQLPLQEH